MYNNVRFKIGTFLKKNHVHVTTIVINIFP